MEEVIGKIKEHANKAKDGAYKLTQTVLGKTNTVVSQTKLKFAISKTEDKIKELYAQIGCDIYASYAGGATEYPDVQELCEKLDDLHKEAENLKAQLEELTETQACPACGASNPADNAYCAKCGEKLNEKAVPAEKDEPEVVTITPEDAAE